MLSFPRRSLFACIDHRPRYKRNIKAICVCIAVAWSFGGQAAWAQISSDASEAVHWSRSEFVIPFQIDSSGELPAEVRLEVSEDQGRSWTLYTHADARTRQFRYLASTDGEFRFRLKTVDRKGNVFDNPGAPLVVIVDTTKPTGELLVDVDSKGVMQAECRIADIALDPSSLKVEYQTDITHQWTPIACDIQPAEQPGHWIAFGTWEMPNDASQLAVRVSVRDRAGNTSEWIRMPRLPRSAGIGREMKLASNRDRSEGSKRIGAGILRTPESLNPDFPKIEVLGGPGARGARNELDRNAPLRDQVLESQQRIIEYQNRVLMEQRATAKPSAAKPSAEELASKPPESLIVPNSPRDPDLVPMAHSRNSDPNTSVSLDTLHSNSRQFSLDYSIDNDPDAALASIELWGTIDRGDSWQKWGTDSDRQSPLDVEVAEDGLFGFRMVIVGANGVASKRPLPGDDADAWIRVDTEVPQARILSVLNGKGADTGSLVIEFLATDDFLGERPISFQCAEKIDGPWKPIAQGARNSGRYVWTPDVDSPSTVYLRIQVIDAAGNLATHQLDLPVNVQSASPKGRIQGFHAPAR